MRNEIQQPAVDTREQWLNLVNGWGVGHRKSLRTVEVLGGVVQATVGDPPGRIALEGLPASVLMFNVSPVQRLRQTREGRSFISDMLSGEMTLLSRGMPSEWSWDSICDRLDVTFSTDVLGDGKSLDVVDRYAFRDVGMEVMCRRLYHSLTSNLPTEQLYLRIARDELGRDSATSSLDRFAGSQTSPLRGLVASPGAACAGVYRGKPQSSSELKKVVRNR